MIQLAIGGLPMCLAERRPIRNRYGCYEVWLCSVLSDSLAFRLNLALGYFISNVAFVSIWAMSRCRERMVLYLVVYIDIATFPSLSTRYRLINNLTLEITFLNLSRDWLLKSYQKKTGLWIYWTHQNDKGCVTFTWTSRWWRVSPLLGPQDDEGCYLYLDTRMMKDLLLLPGHRDDEGCVTFTWTPWRTTLTLSWLLWDCYS